MVKSGRQNHPQSPSICPVLTINEAPVSRQVFGIKCNNHEPTSPAHTKIVKIEYSLQKQLTFKSLLCFLYTPILYLSAT